MSIFRRFFGKKAPPTPLRATAGKKAGAEKYSTLTEEEAQGFLDGDYLPVVSSCVRGVQFHREARSFMVEWLDEKTGAVTPWLYSNVPESVARGFLAAGSKGSFCSLTFTHSKWSGRKL